MLHDSSDPGSESSFSATLNQIGDPSFNWFPCVLKGVLWLCCSIELLWAHWLESFIQEPAAIWHSQRKKTAAFRAESVNGSTPTNRFYMDKENVSGYLMDCHTEKDFIHSRRLWSSRGGYKKQRNEEMTGRCRILTHTAEEKQTHVSPVILEVSFINHR